MAGAVRLARGCSPAQEEVTAVATIIDELERSIRGALATTEHWQQGSLFEVDDERDQLRADHEALLARLDALPDQREDTPRLPSPSEHHAEWQGLLRPDGPFLVLPVLTAALPQGLDTVPGETRARIRQAWAEVAEAPDLLGPAWQDLIFGELLTDVVAVSPRWPSAQPSSAGTPGYRWRC